MQSPNEDADKPASPNEDDDKSESAASGVGAGDSASKGADMLYALVVVDVCSGGDYGYLEWNENGAGGCDDTAGVERVQIRAALLNEDRLSGYECDIMSEKAPECHEDCGHEKFDISAKAFVFTTSKDRDTASAAIARVDDLIGNYDSQKHHSYDLHCYDFKRTTPKEPAEKLGSNKKRKTH
jgi:hypothetical protein